MHPINPSESLNILTYKRETFSGRSLFYFQDRRASVLPSLSRYIFSFRSKHAVNVRSGQFLQKITFCFRDRVPNGKIFGAKSFPAAHNASRGHIHNIAVYYRLSAKRQTLILFRRLRRETNRPNRKKNRSAVSGSLRPCCKDTTRVHP